MYKKVPIFRCTTPSTGKRLGEVVVGTLREKSWFFFASFFFVIVTPIVGQRKETLSVRKSQAGV